MNILKILLDTAVAIKDPATQLFIALLIVGLVAALSIYAVIVALKRGGPR